MACFKFPAVESLTVMLAESASLYQPAIRDPVSVLCWGFLRSILGEGEAYLVPSGHLIKSTNCYQSHFTTRDQ